MRGDHTRKASRVSRKEPSTIRKYGASDSFVCYLFSIDRVYWINGSVSITFKHCIAKRAQLPCQRRLCISKRPINDAATRSRMNSFLSRTCHANGIKQRENITDWNHLRVTGFAGTDDTSAPMAMNGPIQVLDFHVGNINARWNIYTKYIHTKRAWSIVFRWGYIKRS